MRIVAHALVPVTMMWAMGCGGLIAPVDPVDPVPPPVTPTPDPFPPSPTPSPSPSPSPDLPKVASNGLAPDTCLGLITAAGSHSVKLATMNLATGYVARGVTLKLQTDHTLDPSSLAAVGNEAIFCDKTRIIRASRSDGSVRIVERECASITADDTGIYVLPEVGQAVIRYADLDALDAGSPATKVAAMPGSVLGVGPSGLLSTWYSGSKVVSTSGVLDLQGYDGSIFGVSGAAGGRIVISVPDAKGGAPGLLAFDAATGKALGALVTLPVASKDTYAAELGFKGFVCAY